MNQMYNKLEDIYKRATDDKQDNISTRSGREITTAQRTRIIYGNTIVTGMGGLKKNITDKTDLGKNVK